MALAESQKLVITVLIILLLIGGFGFMIWKDRAEYLRLKEQSMRARQEIEQIKKEKISLIPELENRLSALRSHESTYRAILPTDKEDKRFLDFIERARKETGVEISLIAEDRMQGIGRGQKGNVEEYAFELKLVGTLDQTIRFYNMLEAHGYDDRYMRLIQVNEFKIKKLDEEENTLNQNDVRVKVSIFSYKEPTASAVKAASPAKTAGGSK